MDPVVELCAVTANGLPRPHVEKLLKHTVDDVAEIYDAPAPVDCRRWAELHTIFHPKGNRLLTSAHLRLNLLTAPASAQAESTGGLYEYHA